MTVWIYDQGEDMKVFATEEIAQAWLDENDPDGVAFEYEVIGSSDAEERRTGSETAVCIQFFYT
ncbi:hypothetical protein [Bradyrhizobium sp. 76]|uniref:hypothetical protein n=1 Tax=Bradyrhizobium sp. 76 TaxID=2782680 RepID=UPI001FFACB75|nr:hypothetical protein [Bradyrhizobium sp. 76]MCK1406785.1 hypothetical protein [Bradyrhizobium sp. 76]